MSRNLSRNLSDATERPHGAQSNTQEARCSGRLQTREHPNQIRIFADPDMSENLNVVVSVLDTRISMLRWEKIQSRPGSADSSEHLAVPAEQSPLEEAQDDQTKGSVCDLKE
ncbi:hypothetical protein EYF80_040355 [Liparis tanakae]|uniref:Uncharacterized protein n=1 Tax=Liparis tanakae TaxID=230148 RepID=A0A4Z2G7I2_9TELE|nr:hypothetical protein EYF80_040355 [Liparis tanakae]